VRKTGSEEEVELADEVVELADDLLGSAVTAVGEGAFEVARVVRDVVPQPAGEGLRGR